MLSSSNQLNRINNQYFRFVFVEKKNKFLDKNPGEKFKELCGMIDNDRKSWYLIFSDIRNKIEKIAGKIWEKYEAIFVPLII